MHITNIIRHQYFASTTPNRRIKSWRMTIIGLYARPYISRGSTRKHTFTIKKEYIYVFVLYILHLALCYSAKRWICWMTNKIMMDIIGRVSFAPMLALCTALWIIRIKTATKMLVGPQLNGHHWRMLSNSFSVYFQIRHSRRSALSRWRRDTLSLCDYDSFMCINIVEYDGALSRTSSFLWFYFIFHFFDDDLGNISTRRLTCSWPPLTVAVNI